MQIDGDTALEFFAGVEVAMDNAGGGKYRAFNLVTELKAIGIRLMRDPEAKAQTAMSLVHPDSEAAD